MCNNKNKQEYSGLKYMIANGSFEQVGFRDRRNGGRGKFQSFLVLGMKEQKCLLISAVGHANVEMKVVAGENVSGRLEKQVTEERIEMIDFEKETN